MRLERVALLAHPPHRQPVLAGRRLTFGLLVVVVALVGSLTVGIQRADAIYRITHPVPADHLNRVHWTDTWGAPRSGGRSHIGVDIMGPKMIPLVAANDSVVTWGEFDNAGGNIVRLRDANGWEYQYIHINNDTPGTDDGRAACRHAFVAKICNSLSGHRIKRGLEFKAGELIGYLGDSGNAEWTAPHLHFEIYKPSGGRTTPVNPTPYVNAAVTAQPTVAEVALPAGSPWPDVSTAVDEIYTAVEGRPATANEAEALARALEKESVAAALASTVDGNNSAAMIDRLYLIFFRRLPDAAGYRYWLDRRGDGESLEDIADWFARSDEFQRRYGGRDFSEFLDLLYRDVLARDPDAAGNRYWLDRLASGEVSKGTIVVYFSEGDEATRRYKRRAERTVLEWILNGRRPSNADIAEWAELRRSTALTPAVQNLLAT